MLVEIKAFPVVADFLVMVENDSVVEIVKIEENYKVRVVIKNTIISMVLEVY